MLRLSTSMGWQGSDVDFLGGIPLLEAVEIYARNVRDISVLEKLPRLRLIGLECELRTAVRLDQLAMLETFKSTWSDAVSSVLACSTMLRFNIVDWAFEDLLPLERFSKLRQLRLTSKKLQKLAGISRLKGLEFLDLFACPQLSDLAEIAAVSSLGRIELDGCKRLVDIAPLCELRALTHLTLDNCGAIASLSPLRNCNALESLSFLGTTDIQDGDLSVLEGLPRLKELRFKRRAHYDRTREQILR